jgi:hypothetical protein
MKAIGVILTGILMFVFVVIPLACMSYIGGENGINLVETNFGVFVGIFFSTISSGGIWMIMCAKFYEWFMSRVKED